MWRPRETARAASGRRGRPTSAAPSWAQAMGPRAGGRVPAVMGGLRQAGQVGFGGAVVGEDDAAAVGGEDAGDHVQESGLSGTARAHGGDLLRVAEREGGDVDDRDDGAVGGDELFLVVVAGE